MRNHGNYVASLSQLGRFLAQEAEAGGATILPETPATKLLVTDGRVRGVRTGDSGRGRDGEELPNFEPARTSLAQVTVLAEGTQGHLTGAAIERFGLQGASPQVWALGVKEVWEVAQPLDRIDPHDGLAAPRRRASTASSAARSSIRWARAWSRSGWSSGSTTATPSSRSTTCSRS